jgi:hypothetical protein
MNNKYKQIFELVSPVGSDDDFIREVVERAEQVTIARSRTANPMYALSAALVAVVVLSALVINLFDNNNSNNPTNSIVPLASNGIGEEIGTPAATATTLDPDNPYNLQIAVNTFENWEVEIVNIWGSENNMFVLIEFSIAGSFIESVEKFYRLYPGVQFWGTLFDRGEYEHTYGYHSDIYVNNGKVYLEIYARSRFGFPENEFEIAVYNMDLSRIYHNSPFPFVFLPHAIENAIIATFTANYEPWHVNITGGESDEFGESGGVTIELGEAELDWWHYYRSHR